MEITHPVEPVSSILPVKHNGHTRLRHLVIHLSECRRHLVCESPGHDHDVTLSWTCTEDNAQPILVISSCSHVHHLDSAASQT